MDPVNVHKGYGKINDLEDQAGPPIQHHRRTNGKSILVTIFIFAGVLLTLSIILIMDRDATGLPPDSPPSLSAAESIKIFCNVTLYPNSCFTSMSSAASSQSLDPSSIFNLSLQISLTEISNVSSYIKNLTKNSNSISNGGIRLALKDCESQIEDAMSRLNDSILEIDVNRPVQEWLTERKISNIQTWISGAMSDEQSCLDGLTEMMKSSTLLDEVKRQMTRSREYLSNSLAIVANVRVILQEFHLSLHF